jgi:hypothetical protein
VSPQSAFELFAPPKSTTARRSLSYAMATPLRGEGPWFDLKVQTGDCAQEVQEIPSSTNDCTIFIPWISLCP